MTQPDEVRAAGLVARPGPGDAWTVLPTAAGLTRDGDGRPSLTVLEAGPAAFLSLTAELPMPAAALAALAEAVAQHTGRPAAQVRLVPATLGTGRAVLSLDDEVLASTTTSGSATQSAAFSVTLSATRVAAVRAALAGERDRLVVSFTFEAPRPTGTSGSSSSTFSSTTTSTTTSGGTTTTREEHCATATAEPDGDTPPGHEGQPATQPDEPTPLHLSTDAADWRAA